MESLLCQLLPLIFHLAITPNFSFSSHPYFDWYSKVARTYIFLTTFVTNIFCFSLWSFTVSSRKHLFPLAHVYMCMILSRIVFARTSLSAQPTIHQVYSIAQFNRLPFLPHCRSSHFQLLHTCSLRNIFLWLHKPFRHWSKSPQNLSLSVLPFLSVSFTGAYTQAVAKWSESWGEEPGYQLVIRKLSASKFKSPLSHRIYFGLA